MSPSSEGLVQSLQARLLNYARSVGADPNTVLARYGLERFLHRLGRSTYADRFILKGGMLLRVWLGETSRPTRDADLLGYGDLSAAELGRIFGDVCDVAVEPDGVTFSRGSVRVAPIRVEDQYGGQRVKLRGLLGNARLALQLDIGIGDSVTPEPEWIDYPSLLDLPKPRLRAYRPETAIAEKLHAMSVLGMANTRMRDIFDLYELSRRHEFDAGTLVSAVRETFSRRRTSIGPDLPAALTTEFGRDPDKQTQWKAFVRKSRVPSAPQELLSATSAIVAFVERIWAAADAGKPYTAHWPPGGEWRAPARRRSRQ